MLISGSKRKAISLWLAIIFVLQSCSVYQHELSSLDMAIAKDVEVKATKSNGETYIIRKIEKIDSVYYGEVDSGRGYERLIISDNDFEKIQLYDKGGSIAGNSFLLLIAGFVLVGSIIVANCDCIM